MWRKGHNFRPLSFLGAHGAGGQAARPNVRYTPSAEYTQTRQKKLRYMDACSRMDESQKHGKEPDVKDYILYDFIYRRGKTLITENPSAVACDQGLGRGLTAKGHEETFEKMETFCIMSVVVIHDIDICQHSSHCTCKVDELYVPYASMKLFFKNQVYSLAERWNHRTP